MPKDLSTGVFLLLTLTAVVIVSSVLALIYFSNKEQIKLFYHVLKTVNQVVPVPDDYGFMEFKWGTSSAQVKGHTPSLKEITNERDKELDFSTYSTLSAVKSFHGKEFVVVYYRFKSDALCQIRLALNPLPKERAEAIASDLQDIYSNQATVGSADSGINDHALVWQSQKVGVSMRPVPDEGTRRYYVDFYYKALWPPQSR